MKFFGPLEVFHLVAKLAYKLELFARQGDYNIFYILLLKQDITRQKQIIKLPKLRLELDIRENKEYEMEIIKNSVVYTNQVIPGQ